MTLTEPHKRVLHVVHVQYPASLAAESVVRALDKWRMKERQVINLLNEMVKWGYIEYASCQKQAPEEFEVVRPGTSEEVERLLLEQLREIVEDEDELGH